MSDVQWAVDCNIKLPNSDNLVCNHYEESLKLIPIQLRETVKRRIQEIIPPVQDESEILNWKQ